MQVNVLGTLRVVVSGIVVPISADQQRIVLAILAMHAGKPVSIEAIARAIWGDRLPDSWRISARSLIKRLRRALGDDDCTLISNPVKGYYVLNIGLDDVDALRFSSLRKEGLALLEAGKFEPAHTTLSEAEGLWDGIPFDDVPSDSLRRDEVPSLEKDLVNVVSGRLEASIRLSCRRAGNAIPEMERLITRHPDQAPLRRLLILALYRAGRYTESVNAYRTWWSYLREEAGAKPGPRLTELIERVNAEDQTLYAEPLGYDLLP